MAIYLWVEKVDIIALCCSLNIFATDCSLPNALLIEHIDLPYTLTYY